MLIDCHCHLNELSEKKLNELIKEASKYNINKFVSNSVDLNSIKKNLEIQSHYKQIITGIALHPTNLMQMHERELEETLAFILENIKKAKAGLGETGLDFKFAKTKEQKNKQLFSFKFHLELAEKHNIAISIHSRFACTKTLELIESYNLKKALLHWFSGNKKEFNKGIELDCFFSINYKMLPCIQENLKAIPLEKILLESDYPINSIQSIPKVLSFIASKLKLNEKELKEKIKENSKKLFKIN